MNYEYQIAKRLFFDHSGEKRVSRPAVRIAVIGIAVGLAVMLLAVAIVTGFKHQVEENVVGMSSHIQVTAYMTGDSYEMNALEMPDSLPAVLSRIPGVRHVQKFTTKPGVIKTDDHVEAVVFKGVSEDFDPDFLCGKITRGQLPEYMTSADSVSAEVLISEDLAHRLRLQPGDSFISYFIRNERITARKWTVCGMFETHFSEFDRHFVLAGNRQLARINGWEPEQTGGIELFVDNVRELYETDMKVYETLLRIGAENGQNYYSRSIYDLYPDMFGWLDLLDMNVWLILVLMCFVSGFNMISGLLILILERTNLIGMLKAMGAGNRSVRKVFLYLSGFLIGKGILWGNLIGLGLCAIQYFFRILPLDSAVYYVDAVPIEWNLGFILLLNIGTVAVSLLMMLLPSTLVSRISPVKAIRFD